MSQQIQDYLQTQSLSLPNDAVAVARAATQAVLQNGQAHIDTALLQHNRLPENLARHIHQFKPIFMALDSVYSRQKVQTAVIYALPDGGNLVRVAQMGAPIETHLPVNETMAAQYLPARTALSGWANIAEDVKKWLQMGELCGEQHHRAACQISLPICGEDGVVFGVVQVEASTPLSADELAEWVGLALGILPVLRECCPHEDCERK